MPEGLLYPIELRLNLAEIYRETGNDDAAKQQIGAAEALVKQLQIEGPARAEFLRVRASIRLGSNDLNGAESDLKEAMRVDPGNAAITLQYANLLWHAKRSDEARKLYENFLRSDPKNRYALEALGYIARENNDAASAEHYFELMAADYPTDYMFRISRWEIFTPPRGNSIGPMLLTKRHSSARHATR